MVSNSKKLWWSMGMRGREGKESMNVLHPDQKLGDHIEQEAQTYLT
jgi:hypothetical protein